jgi:hypothetical protein
VVGPVFAHAEAAEQTGCGIVEVGDRDPEIGPEMIG